MSRITTTGILTSSGNWVAPSGVTWVVCIGSGGGGAGAAGNGGGGGGALPGYAIVPVVPNTTYAYTIGAGASTSASDGGDTILGAGNLFRAMGANSGHASGAGGFGGNSVRNATNHAVSAKTCGSPAAGGDNTGLAGNVNYMNLGGIYVAGTGVSTFGGGGSGSRGNGGNANSGGAGVSGGANTGAGGGAGSTTGGAGGTGYLYIVWIE